MWQWLFKPRNVEPTTIFRVGFAVVGLCIAFWFAGLDRAAMIILTTCLLFSLATYGAYLDNPILGRLALHQGGLAGAVLSFVFVIGVVARHSYQTQGMMLPNSAFEVLMLGMVLGVFVPFGASVGGMFAILGEWAVRMSLAISWQAFGHGEKSKAVQQREDWSA